MRILAIETSADETAAAVTDGRKVIAQVTYSQILMHAKWGGIYPSLAKRAHEEKIDQVVQEVLAKAKTRDFKKEIDYIAVTYGPGLAIALEVGIRKAKELAEKYDKKIIPVNHLEGHIYSCFVQNSKGNPLTEFRFPYLAFVISGGHTEIALFKDHVQYKVLGHTLDDAAGEALDKAAKMLGLGYPGGPVIEQLSHEVNNVDLYHFPRPMLKSENIDFSFSGLKTSFFYYLKKLDEKQKLSSLKQLCSAYQEAVFDTLTYKLEKAVKQTKINRVVVGGGVSANKYLRTKLKGLMKSYKGEVLFPSYPYLTGDNASMIGVAAYFKAQKQMFVKNTAELDRIPRLSL